MEAKAPTEADAEGICASLAAVHAVLRGSGTDLVEHLQASARLQSQTGSIYGTAYNTGFFEPLLSHSPAGALPDHLTANPGYVVSGEDRFLAIEYLDPSPRWLTFHKHRHEAARESDPSAWERVVAGRSPDEDLRDLWRNGYRQGTYNWGGDTVSNWKQTTLDPFLFVSARFNQQVEAISHAVMTALVDPLGSDLGLATRASALFIPSWLGTGLGVSDETGTRPTVAA